MYMASQALCQLPRVVETGIVQILMVGLSGFKREMLRDAFTSDDRWNIVILAKRRTKNLETADSLCLVVTVGR